MPDQDGNGKLTLTPKDFVTNELIDGKMVSSCTTFLEFRSNLVPRIWPFNMRKHDLVHADN